MLSKLLRKFTNDHFFFLTLRFRFESLQYPERGKGGSSIETKAANFNIF